MLITIFLGPRFIELLRAREFGQQIREEGPAEHQTKAGTPTMGGLIVFVAIAVPYLVLSPLDTQSLAVFGVALGAAGLGFADDFIKVTKRRSLGLSARWKLVAQIGLAVALWWVASEEVGLDPSLQVRISDAEIYIGPVLYVLVVFLVIAGASNAVNLTDGLDGLAAGSCAIVLLAYTAITITSGQEGLALLSACLVGASVGFLWFNSFPAAIFMGDTGSLGLGAAIGALAVMTQTELLVDHPRRDLRDRGALGGDSGVQLQAVPPPGAADGPGPPPLRDDGLVGDQDHAPLLDRRRRLRGDRLHAVPELDPRLKPRPPLPDGPYLVVGLARSGQAAARMLSARGAEVAGCDSGSPEGAARLAEAGLEVHLDSDGVELLDARALRRQEPRGAAPRPR